MYIPFDHLLATMVFSLAGVPREITWSMGFKDEGGPGTDDPSVDAESIRVAYALGPYAAASMLIGWSFMGVRVQRGTTGGEHLIGESMLAVTGTSSAAPLPVNCAYLMTKHTALGGRRHRGRAFLPPTSVDETLVNAAGVFLPTYASSVASAQQGVLTTLAALTYPLEAVILHSLSRDPVTGEEIGSVGGLPSPTPITSLSVSTTLATQRRRMR